MKKEGPILQRLKADTIAGVHLVISWGTCATCERKGGPIGIEMVCLPGGAVVYDTREHNMKEGLPRPRADSRVALEAAFFPGQCSTL